MVEALARSGITHMAGVIGSSVIDIIEATAAQSALRYVGVRHEQAASSMADGFARVSGRPMACIGHAGPGACNLLVGVASAYRDSVPMLVITGNTGSRRLGRDAWHELDVLSIYRTVTKWSTRVSRPEEIGSVICRAVTLASEGRRGPVHVDIPQDMAAAEVDAGLVNLCGVTVTALPSIDPAVVAEVARRLMSSSRPLIFAGGGVVWAGASEALAKVARRLRAPVVTSETSRGVMPDEDELCLGMLGLYGNSGSSAALKDCDLLLAVGCRFSETTTLGWSSIPRATPVIQVDVDARELGRQLPIESGIAADANVFLEALDAELASRQKSVTDSPVRTNWHGDLRARREADSRAFYDKATNASPVKPQFLIREVAAVFGSEVIFSIGQGNHTAFCMKLPIEASARYLQSVGLGTLGFAFPAALGAKLAAPERTVVCLVGDGDLGTVMQELETAARESIKVVTVVFNNSGFGVNRMSQLARKVRPIGVEFRDTDYAKLAQVLGMQSFRVTQARELRPALESALAANGPVLVDVVIDPTERAGVDPKSVGIYT